MNAQNNSPLVGFNRPASRISTCCVAYATGIYNLSHPAASAPRHGATISGSTLLPGNKRNKTKWTQGLE
jgi:hypothetical protein